MTKYQHWECSHITKYFSSYILHVLLVSWGGLAVTMTHTVFRQLQNASDLKSDP